MRGICAIALALLFGIHGAAAENFTFRIKSNYKYKVQIEFYSQARDSAWPGDGMAYELNDSQVHDYSLRCQSGERICYGAWVTGNSREYWGAGLHARQGCSSCCYTCDGGETAVITLNGSAGDDDDDDDD